MAFVKLKKKMRVVKKNDHVLLLWNILRTKKQKRLLKKYSDEEMIEKVYNSKFSTPINLENPIRYTEKIQWLKLNYREDELSNYADKYAVRQIIKDKGYENLLTKVIGIWDDVDEVDIEVLPTSFVLKATHGSGMNLIVKDKTKVNWFIWKKIMNCWLEQNIYIDGREWPYKNIKPRIMCEEIIETKGEDLRDYKFFCFNGEPKLIQVNPEGDQNNQIVFYNTNWELQDFQLGNYGTDYCANKPEMLNEMIEIAKDLSKPFPFSRIDFYNIGKKIIFGEVTFSPSSGFLVIKPEAQDIEMGNMLKLPNETFLR